MLLRYTLLLLLVYTMHPMDRTVKHWTSQEFDDLVAEEQLRIAQEEQDADVHRYLNKKPAYCPLTRRQCVAATFWLTTFVPAIIASHPALETKLTSLPISSYIIGAGVLGAYVGYEIKKLTKILKYPMLNNVDIEQEIFESCI